MPLCDDILNAFGNLYFAAFLYRYQQYVTNVNKRYSKCSFLSSRCICMYMYIRTCGSNETPTFVCPTEIDLFLLLTFLNSSYPLQDTLAYEERHARKKCINNNLQETLGCRKNRPRKKQNILTGQTTVTYFPCGIWEKREM